MPDHSLLLFGCGTLGLAVVETLRSRGFDFLLTGVVDPAAGSDLIFFTGGVDHCLKPGDFLVLIGPDEDIQHFRHDTKGVAPVVD